MKKSFTQEEFSRFCSIVIDGIMNDIELSDKGNELSGVAKMAMMLSYAMMSAKLSEKLFEDKNTILEFEKEI